ncbi:Hsp20/alpha crystallin family protein [Gloeothece citriformis]|nr:Hsp20/alpha crystallin family protein [Gloeothece citriformis]
MTLVRYNPFRDLDILQRQMNRLFDESFLSDTKENGIPAAEISETEDAIHLKLELPGIAKEDLDIQVTKNAVSVSGERKEETKTETNGVTRSEFRYGKFSRVIPLPVHVQNNNVTAQYKDGILTLTLPKSEEEKNKVVKVQVG